MTATPWPIPDADTQAFWDAVTARRLILQRCDACGRHQHYPRAVCTACSSTRLSWVDSVGRGTVYSFTVSRRAPHPAFGDRIPLVVALVDLDEGVRMLANLVEVSPDEVAIGMRVTVTFIDVADDVVLPAFVLEERMVP